MVMRSAPALAVAAVTAVTFVQAYSYPAFQGNLLIYPGANLAKCIQADNRDGAPVVIADCTGSAAQKWKFGPNGQVSLYNGTKCLDVTGGVDADGTKVQVYTCSANNANQQWNYGGYGKNYIQWSKGAKRQLDLTKGNFTNGNQVQIWTQSKKYDGSNQVWDVGYRYNQGPSKSQNEQYGTNKCGTTSSQSSKCQTAWINDAEDFCLWGPPDPNSSVGDSEAIQVAWCTKSGRGTRLIPNGALKGVHFVRTPDYVQVTGVGDFTKINIEKNDPGGGGELDPHGADGRGNPIGGLVYGNTFSPNLQYAEWTNFMSDKEFCFRACTGPNARENCQHIYDVMGCYWNMPANYDSGVFESCKADNDLPMGVYGTSTWHQGVSPTPGPHPVAKSSSCTSYKTISTSPVKRDLEVERMVKRGLQHPRTAAPSF